MIATGPSPGPGQLSSAQLSSAQLSSDRTGQPTRAVFVRNVRRRSPVDSTWWTRVRVGNKVLQFSQAELCVFLKFTERSSVFLKFTDTAHTEMIGVLETSQDKSHFFYKYQIHGILISTIALFQLELCAQSMPLDLQNDACCQSANAHLFFVIQSYHH